MNTVLKNTTIALFTINLAACGVIDTVTEGSAATSDSMDSGMDQLTGGQFDPMHFACYNESNYQVNLAGQPVYFDLMHTCVQLKGPDWMTDENMVKILDGCTTACTKAYGGVNNHCVNEGWKSVEPTGTECDPKNYGPEYGGDILWLDGVQSSDRQVKCDLRTTCGDLFGAAIAERLQSGAVLPDERPLSGAQRRSELQLRVAYGDGGPLDVAGTIEYSTSQCGETACPLYLGDAELLQSSDDWRMVLVLGELGRIDKQISNVRVRLAKPALGISLTDGQVAFPAESLTFHVEAEVAGAVHPLVENGAQSFWVQNPVAVVGRLDDGSLDLEMDVATLFGSVRLTTLRDE